MNFFYRICNKFLRSKGYKRHLSIFEIRSSVCNKYRALTQTKHLEMITPISKFGFGKVDSYIDVNLT